MSFFCCSFHQPRAWLRIEPVLKEQSWKMKINQSYPSSIFEPLDQTAPEDRPPLLLKLINLLPFPPSPLPSSLPPLPSFLLILFFFFLTLKKSRWVQKGGFCQRVFKVIFISLSSQALHSPHSCSEKQLNFPLYLLRAKLCVSMLYFLSA